MRDDVMWAWDYELRTLGSWPGERYTGHNVPVEVVTKADHDVALRRAKAEVLREVKYEALGSRIKCFKSDTLYAEGNDDALNAVVKWIDARAAQIEEGE
jgi:hypothetical protein